MQTLDIKIKDGKKLYFASDFHFGVPNFEISLAREKKVIAWLDSIKHDAQTIFLLGDVFDFWFEYRQAVPKGFIRFLGKIAELQDQGIEVKFFTGNHDMWMFDYLPKELGVEIYYDPVLLKVSGTRLLLGHGDGLGPGDQTYKLLKKVFTSKFCQWLFARIHPNLGISIAHRWSRNSRISNMKLEEKFNGEEREFLLAWCKETEKKDHHDFYLFGHRHLPLDLKVGENSRYINLGEWVHFSPYAVFDGQVMELKSF